MESRTGRLLILLGILLAGAGAWYWRHLQFLDKRGLLYEFSPEYGGHILLAGCIIVTAAVLFVAWRELFPGKQQDVDRTSSKPLDEDPKAP